MRHIKRLFFCFLLFGLLTGCRETEAVSDETVDLPRIICWGDSLTEGTGGDGVTYPNTLEELSGREVINYGVYAETASCIAARQGGNPMHTRASLTIPSACEPVELILDNEKGNPEMLLVFGDAGINPCSIGGVEGTLSIDMETGNRYFTRNEAGEPVTIEAGTQMLFHAMLDKRTDDILVIFSGTNDYPDTESIEDVIAYQRAMLAYAGAENYVIIGMTKKKAMPKIEEINQILEEEYGEHFLDIRKYLLENGLQDAGVTETQQDRADLESGEIPSSLRTDDEGHGTSEFYRIIGEQLYLKLLELNYLTR
ncbi:MAG TPA: hypothetical protein PLU43_07210 [Lachnospiraceae bacterium]|nr:hypothetical protein [Lachnospiraceae bacterium]